MKKNLLPSRLLLIAPKFFGYENEIAAELGRLGYFVDVLPDRPFDGSLMKAIMRFRPELGGNLTCDRFFAQQLESLGRSEYSIILVIQGEGVTSKTLMRLKNAYPRALIVFYTWDSIENKPFSKKNLRFYDRSLSFDPTDSNKYDLIFRPLFYTKTFELQKSHKYEYDISFIGTVHSDRYKIIKSFLQEIPSNSRNFLYLYMQASWMYHFRRIATNTIAGARHDEFHFTPLDSLSVHNIFLGSRAILDIEHVSQRGATMRTMEALGSERKIITTNTNLRDYDFYNATNIQIIDRNAPRLDPTFLETPYKQLPYFIRRRYSLRQWCLEVCGLVAPFTSQSDRIRPSSRRSVGSLV